MIAKNLCDFFNRVPSRRHWTFGVRMRSASLFGRTPLIEKRCEDAWHSQGNFVQKAVQVSPDRVAQKSPSVFVFLSQRLRRVAGCDIALAPRPMSSR